MPPKKTSPKLKHENFWEKITAIYFHMIAFVGIVLLVVGAIMTLDVCLKVVFKLEEPYRRTIYLDQTQPILSVKEDPAAYRNRDFTITRAMFCIKNPDDSKCNLNEQEVYLLETKLEENRYNIYYNRYRSLITSSSFLLVGAILVIFHRKKIYA